MATRPAATTLVLRDAALGLQVLMVRRSWQASFMPGSHVFPGGAVDDDDDAPATLALATEDPAAIEARVGQASGAPRSAAATVAALRECFEECGLWLGTETAPAPLLQDLRRRRHAGEGLSLLAQAAALPLHTDVLQPWARWVTPVGLPKRFDTLFFVAPAPAGQQPEADAGETTALAWVHPPQALAEHEQGGFQMEFATVQALRTLLPFAGSTAAQVLAHAAATRRLDVVHPRLQLDAQGHIVGVLLPGQAGYEQALSAPC